jgi:hypothetical protein
MTAPGDRNRARWLLAAGVTDSFGLSFGWTTFTLLAVMRGGLPLAGLYNAAMFVGIVLSAPAATWLSARVSPRTVLAGTGAVELVLRVGTVVALISGVASGVVAAGIVAMNVMAFVAYAAMRAEVAAVEPGARALTRYATAIAAIEALGAAVAALLPLTAHGAVNVPVVTAVIVCYGASLVPQFGCARRAQAGGPGGGTGARPRLRGPVRVRSRAVRGRPFHVRGALGPTWPWLVGGGAVMLVASGPGSLGVALAAELDGQVAVLPSAVVFTAGCLLAPAAAAWVARSGCPANVVWTLFGVVMLAGWLAAPWNLTGLLVAQFGSGVGLTAFQGDMDARVAAHGDPNRVTAALASAAAFRAVGTAIAVRSIPAMVAAPAIGTFSGAALVTLVAGALILRVTAGRGHTQVDPGQPGRTASGTRPDLTPAAGGG